MAKRTYSKNAARSETLRHVLSSENLLQVMQFFRLFGQVFAELRVGHIDQGLRPLTNGFAIQVGNAVFGDHKADMVTAGNHASTLLEHGCDLA